MININHNNYPKKGDIILYKKEKEGFFRKKRNDIVIYSIDEEYLVKTGDVFEIIDIFNADIVLRKLCNTKHYHTTHYIIVSEGIWKLSPNEVSELKQKYRKEKLERICK